MSDTTTTTSTSEAPAVAAAAPAQPAPRLSDAEQEAAVEALLSGKTVTPEKAPAAAPGGDAAAASEAPAGTEGEAETPPAPDAQNETESGVDYALAVPIADGETLTVGELKDHYQASAAREVEMIERENKVMADTEELQRFAQYLNLTPEDRQHIANQQLQHLQRENGLMMQAIPEWKDQAVFQKDRLAIFDLGKEYGVDLTTVSNHKVVKMLRDFSRLKTQIKTARAGLKQVKAPEPKAIQQNQNGKATELSNAVNRAKQTGNIADQTAAVDLLLRG